MTLLVQFSLIQLLALQSFSNAATFHQQASQSQTLKTKLTSSQALNSTALRRSVSRSLSTKKSKMNPLNSLKNGLVSALNQVEKLSSLNINSGTEIEKPNSTSVKNPTPFEISLSNRISKLENAVQVEARVLTSVERELSRKRYVGESLYNSSSSSSVKKRGTVTGGKKLSKNKSSIGLKNSLKRSSNKLDTNGLKSMSKAEKLLKPSKTQIEVGNIINSKIVQNSKADINTISIVNKPSDKKPKTFLVQKSNINKQEKPISKDNNKGNKKHKKPFNSLTPEEKLLYQKSQFQSRKNLALKAYHNQHYNKKITSLKQLHSYDTHPDDLKLSDIDFSKLGAGSEKEVEKFFLQQKGVVAKEDIEELRKMGSTSGGNNLNDLDMSQMLSMGIS